VIGQLAPRSTDENEAAVNEDDRSEDWGDQVRAGKGRWCEAKPVLDIARPEDHWNCESEAQPKLVTKHRHAVSGVTVVTCVGVGSLVPSRLVAL
jgi:hypothetical protein